MTKGKIWEAKVAKISISLPDELVQYLDEQVENRSALIETLLEQWKCHQQDQLLAAACAAVDELDLGWEPEWQNAAITDLEASG
jgi:Arc/MetJ-type ribon-helix-helix transcriptional regulator